MCTLQWSIALFAHVCVQICYVEMAQSFFHNFLTVFKKTKYVPLYWSLNFCYFLCLSSYQQLMGLTTYQVSTGRM